MDLQRKIEFIKGALISLAEHDDEPVGKVEAALAATASYIVQLAERLPEDRADRAALRKAQAEEVKARKEAGKLAAAEKVQEG